MALWRLKCNLNHCSSKETKKRVFYKNQQSRWRRRLPIEEDEKGGKNSIPNKYSGWMY